MLIHRQWLMVWPDGQHYGLECLCLRSNTTGNLVTRTCVDRSFWMVTEHEDVTVYQRATSVEEDLNNQVDKMPCSVDVNQALSTVTPSLPNGLMNKVAMPSEMEIMHGLSNMDFHSLRLICLQWLLRAQRANSRDQLWAPRDGTIPQDDETATWSQVDYTGPHPSWKRQYLVPTASDTLDMSLFSLPSVLWPKPPSVDLHNMIHVEVFPQHCSWPRNSFTSNWSAAMDWC